MSDDQTTDGSLYCERVRLLLSLYVDGEATPEQKDEVTEHLKACGDCRKAQAVDTAVRAHMAGITESVPTTVTGESLVAAGLAERRQARGLNRFLAASAAAAVLTAAIAGGVHGLLGPKATGGDGDALASTRVALIQLKTSRTSEGK